MRILIILFIICQAALSETDIESCELYDGNVGVCVTVEKCPYALNLLKNGENPRICGFQEREPIVCCKETPSDIKDRRKPGEISLKKCDEFYPSDGEVFVSVFRGNLSLAKEFPHMAAIGYESGSGIKWGCGGALISEKFILTAAHCLFSRSFGSPKYVRLGDLDLASTTDDAEPQDYLVKQTIAHPDYKPPLKYHDIGLLELTRSVNRTDYIDIACLDVEPTIDFPFLTVTGWGKTEYAGDSSSFLLKADLERVPQEQCQKFYKNSDLNDLPNGIVEDTMLCAGGESDTCQGDSGGPIFFLHGTQSMKKIYKIVGVTSFGKACGVAKIPGVYTRVYNYLPWIEDIVWP